jgi:hypothetical protein
MAGIGVMPDIMIDIVPNIVANVMIGVESGCIAVCIVVPAGEHREQEQPTAQDRCKEVDSEHRVSPFSWLGQLESAL